MSAYPITASGQMVDEGAVARYFNCLFQHVDWSEGGIVSLLGIGEKGTSREGGFKDRKFVRPGQGSLAVSHARRWAEHEIATFIVPAVVASEAERDGDVKLDKIAAFTALIVDLDSGSTEIKLQHLERHLGRPTMVVVSGGRTSEGSPKLHGYWRLTEPSNEIDRIAAARKLLAAKVGGDQAFGRATQVIRLPGSVHAKGGTPNPVTIRTTEGPDYDLDELLEAIEAMPQVAGCEGAPAAQPDLRPGALQWVQGAPMDFSAGAGRDSSSVSHALTHEIHEGGDDINRWGEFSKVAGLEIANARKGLQTLEQAYELVQGWVLAKMVPPWPIERIRSEFVGILNVDVKAKGAVVEAQELAPTEKIESGAELLTWRVDQRSSNEPPARRVLVDGLVFAAKRHMMVAEGGAGKTYLCMDLALKLALADEGVDQKWLGQRVLPEANGGTVILITGEDDVDELDIRWNAIDPGGYLRARAGPRLIALPLDNLGGAFPLVSMHPATREAVPSPKWFALFRAMREVHQGGGRISAVIIDTLNSTLHGEENSAMVIGEYVRAVAPICGELKAAIIVTHHVRKAGSEPIRSLEDMRDAIRGSTALPNAMRLVIGVWAAHDYERRMRTMGMTPQRATLFRAGVVKANMPEALREPKTLIRDKAGLLGDVTHLDILSRGPSSEAKAWLVWAVKQAADARAPFAKSGQNGVHARRHQLPRLFHNMGRDNDILPLVDDLLASGDLIAKPLAEGSKAHNYLDVPECLLVPRYMNVNQGLDLKLSNFYYDHGWDEIRSSFEE